MNSLRQGETGKFLALLLELSSSLFRAFRVKLAKPSNIVNLRARVTEEVKALLQAPAAPTESPDPKDSRELEVPVESVPLEPVPLELVASLMPLMATKFRTHLRTQSTMSTMTFSRASNKK